MENKNKDFEVIQSSVNEEISSSDFVLVNNKEFIHDQKFETKPTTFLKDSIKRFAKNKSSVVAAAILGVLLAMSFVVPLVDQSNVKKINSNLQYLEPKLFNAGSGFWDGTRKYTGIGYDPVTNRPNPTNFKSIKAVSNLKVDEIKYTNSTDSAYAWGGFVRFASNKNESKDFVYLQNQPIDEVNLAYNHTIEFDIRFEEFSSYQQGQYAIYFDSDETDSIELRSYDEAVYGEKFSINLNEKLSSGGTIFHNVKIQVRMDTTQKGVEKMILVKSIVFDTDSNDEDYKIAFKAPNFYENDDGERDITDAYAMVKNVRLPDGTFNDSYWQCSGSKLLYKVAYQTCSFTYDTYEAALGEITMSVDMDKFKNYKSLGWCTYNFSTATKDDPTNFTFQLTEEGIKNCPVIKVNSVTPTGVIGKITYNIECQVYYYKYLGHKTMPRYLMGTDVAGRDMFKYVFEGLRTSLLLGIITSAVCFIFGLCWGAISGYFGGNVDLAMERFTDILGGMPWIVLMTLCIIHLGQNFVTFALALCLTGWIGTSSTTRTQFYRFKGREYVLASRTLGSSDIRLIFKHILPNAMGTIITGAVLMIPSVIFSEATISYLGLGLKGLSSLGVILSDNQSATILSKYPYLMVFPSTIIALLMISFNLFGNGLRDAVNPSLKGEGE